MVLVALKRLLLNILRKQHPQRTVRSEASGVVVNMNLIGPGAPPQMQGRGRGAHPPAPNRTQMRNVQLSANRHLSFGRGLASSYRGGSFNQRRTSPTMQNPHYLQRTLNRHRHDCALGVTALNLHR